MVQVKITVTAVATKLVWWMLNYPVSNECYWSLRNDDEKILVEGNHSIPKEVIDQWGTDDSYIENYLINDAKVGQ